MLLGIEAAILLGTEGLVDDIAGLQRSQGPAVLLMDTSTLLGAALGPLALHGGPVGGRRGGWPAVDHRVLGEQGLERSINLALPLFDLLPH
jgi:hypothetical protein